MRNIKSLAQKVKSINHTVYVVGSYCISKIMNINHYGDTDFASDATPTELEKVLNVIGTIGKKYGTLIVEEGGEIFEITTFRKDIGSINQRKPNKVVFTKDLKLDASRRDFTINALYFDPLTNEFIDPYGGITDIEDQTIRFVGDIEKRLDEDVLRLLRFVRLRSRLGFKEADSNYIEVFKKRIKELENISVERIKEELDKILLTKDNIQALEYLKYIGFFKYFIPDIEKLSQTPGGPKHHLEGNVWIHTLMTIDELNKQNCQDVDMYWACLLHDIGKSKTVTFDDNKNIHYYNHDKLGSELFAKNIARQFRFSIKSASKIKWLIANHIRFIKVREMKKVKAYKFIGNKYFKDLMLLGKCDSIGKTPSEGDRIIEIENFYSKNIKKLNSVKLLKGADIMNKWPKLEGKEIGRKLEEENDKILADL